VLENEWGFIYEFDVIPFTASVDGAPQALPEGWEPVQVLEPTLGEPVLLVRRKLAA